jgi:hypothetical protein
MCLIIAYLIMYLTSILSTALLETSLLGFHSFKVLSRMLYSVCVGGKCFDYKICKKVKYMIIND